MKRDHRAQIWQLKAEAPAVLRFEGFHGIARYGLTFEPDNYELIYEFDHTPEPEEKALENIFVRFNVDRPDDFTGHSLSVSDVIVVNNKAYYVDIIGFHEVRWHDTATQQAAS